MQHPATAHRTTSTAGKLARGSRRPKYGRDGDGDSERESGTKSAMCVGQQLHVVCGARLQIDVGPFAQGHASLGGEALSRIHGLLSPAVLTGLLGQLAADQCSSSRTPMCWPGICAGVPCIDEN
jgi:hypothetical protein